MYSCEIWADADLGQMPIHSVQVPIHASEILSDIHAKCWEPYYYVTNILICCGRCIAVKFGQMPIHSVQVPIHASEILSDILPMSWEPYYYGTNILICCRRCIAVKFGQMPILSVQVPIHASEILSDIHTMHQKFVGHPRYILGTILLCYQYINLLWPMYSREIWADADSFCAGADPCIRNLLDIHAMYWEPYYYVNNILICCGRCITVKFGQMPILCVQVPIHASEICRTSTLCIGNHTAMLPIY